MEHGINLRFKKMRDVSEAAAMARSILHKKVRQLGASAKQPSKPNKAIKSSQSSATKDSPTAVDNKELTIADRNASAVKNINQSSSGICEKIMKQDRNQRKLNSDELVYFHV